MGTDAGIAAAKDPKLIVAEAVRKVATIATLPEVTTRIIKTVEDPRSSATQLHKIVAHDPALVTRILKVVNSSFYGLPGQIASIERAIVLLGLNAVKNIAVAASLGQLFRGVKLCDGFTAKDLWTHCVAVAVTSREIAKSMRLTIADEAFLAGMIHDIGLLVSLQTAPEQLQRVCADVKKGNLDFCQAERAINGVDHQMLGAGLAETWKFPKSCQIVAAHHHNPVNLPEEYRMLVGIIYTADTLCCQEGIGFNLTALQQNLDDQGLGENAPDEALISGLRIKLPALLDTAGAIAA
jgi:putative nucleotidyltransferase with HDIG domain